MKKLTIILLLIAPYLNAQEVFKEHLYSPDLIFKYQEEIGLTEAQEKKIKELYNNSTLSYNHAKWDLDAKMVKLEKLLSQETVDISAAENQLTEILKLENEIKISRLKTMLSIKNELTSAQMNTLNQHKDEFKEGYAVMTSVNEDPRVVVRVSGDKKTNEPLYVIKRGKNNIDFVSNVSNIDPNEIESIQVLKGESAVEKYGEKGRNGVVIIVLK